MNTTTKAIIAVIVTNILFAANYSIAKLVTPALMKPLALNVVRVIVTVTLFWLLYALQPEKTSFKKKHIIRLIICAITGVAINQILFIKGLSLTTSIHASLLSLGTPIFITVIAAFLLKEPLTLQKIIGLLIGISGGAVLISMKENVSAGSNIAFGDFLVVINAISYAFYFVLVKPLMEEYKLLTILRWLFTIGAIIIVPLGWNEFIEIKWAAFSLANWLETAFVAIGATFVGYLLNVYGIQHLGSSKTGAYIYTQPVFAAIIAIVFLKEEFNWQKGLASALIIIAVYLVNKKPKPIQTITE